MKGKCMETRHFTDIHSHIIPGVDDGSMDMEMSLAMLKVAERNHISRIILTPHNKPHTKNAPVSVLKSKVEELRKVIAENSLHIKLYLGTEIYYRDGVEELIDEGEVCTMVDTDVVLVEFSPSDEYSYIKRALLKLQDFGYQPILAHVERYENITSKKTVRAQELAESGVLLQLNAGSVMGDFGRDAAKFCKLILKKGLADFISTDAHRDIGRAPEMLACAEYLYKKYDSEYVDDLLFGNAIKIILEHQEQDIY